MHLMTARRIETENDCIQIYTAITQNAGINKEIIIKFRIEMNRRH